MIKKFKILILFIILGQPLLAAGPVDPDWPCIQRRQPALSLAQFWTGPPADEAVLLLAKDAKIEQLAQNLALRRLDLTAAEGLIADFAAEAKPEAMVALVVATLDRIQTQRNRLMAGITRYAHKQAALDKDIEELRHKFAELSNTAEVDHDQLDRMEVELDWMTRVFQDRQQSLIYVCETPVILEQRAFAIGRLIAAKL